MQFLTLGERDGLWFSIHVVFEGSSETNEAFLPLETVTYLPSLESWITQGPYTSSADLIICLASSQAHCLDEECFACWHPILYEHHTRPVVVVS